MPAYINVTLSIITPTLNAADSIERCILSVINQKSWEVEHIIVDGGSSDDTLMVISRFPQVRVFSEPDHGIYDAMNKGVGVSSGDWIYFLGADDVLADETVLKDITPHFESDQDVIYGDILDKRTGHRYDGPSDKFKIRKRNISHQSIFFRRDVFEKTGLFDQSYRSFADWDHNMRWMLNPNIRKQYVDRVIAHYGGEGFSFMNPDLRFQRDRLYRYLTYGKRELPRWLYWGLWGKELGLGIRNLDWPRLKRAANIPFS